MSYPQWIWAAASVVGIGGCFWGLDPDAYRLACEASAKPRCGGNTIQICVDGRWRDAIPCIAQSCVSAACVGECEAGRTRCIGNAVEICDAGAWKPDKSCAGSTCLDGVCVGSCEPGAARCNANALEVCDANGAFSTASECIGQTCDLLSQGCIGVCAPQQTQCNGNTQQSCDASGSWVDADPCLGTTCVSGGCAGSCEPGQTQCKGDTPQLCDGAGVWQDQAACVGQPCSGGSCGGACAAGSKRCNGNTPQICDGSAVWQNGAPCVDTTCVGGVCQGVCEAGQVQCSGNTPETCDTSGAWKKAAACVNQTCVNGACKGVCESGQVRCTGNVPETCDALGKFQSGATCEAKAMVCVSGVCVPRPSCDGSSSNCGPNGNESCCASPLLPTSTFDRSNDPAFPATVSEFRLDRFEVTVGRFRKFVNAYPASKPASGAGAHPLIAGSGWNSAWNSQLPADKVALAAAVADCGGFSWATWTANSDGGRERFPINCVTWFEAFAFCAWDGGRLPTVAEWNLAAAGGNEQREYPWSKPPSSTTIDPSYAVYDCTGDGSAPQSCDFTDFLRVGSRSPKGDGRYGQADLGGSMWEWVLDWAGAFPNPCTDCGLVGSGSERVVRGGRWGSAKSQLVSYYDSYNQAPVNRASGSGFRCARRP